MKPGSQKPGPSRHKIPKRDWNEQLKKVERWKTYPASPVRKDG